MARPFASKGFSSQFRGRFGFALTEQRNPSEAVQDRVRLMAALLHKVAHRGVPSLVSVETERATLEAASAVRLLRYQEAVSLGTVVFSTSEAIEGLAALLRACLIPELLLTRERAAALVDRYLSLTDSQAERSFLSRVCSTLDDPRLALFVVPQRTFSALGIGPAPSITPADRVDFAVDLRVDGSKIRQVIEIDDSHSAAQLRQDRTRDKAATGAGWVTIRTRSTDTSFAEVADDLAARIRAVAGPRLSDVERLAAMTPEMRAAIIGLIAVPVAEAQVLSFVARQLQMAGSAAVVIKDADGIGIQPAIEAVNRLLAAYEDLLDLPSVGRVMLGSGPSAVPWFFLPSVEAWDALHLGDGAIVPAPVRMDVFETLHGVEPQPVRDLGAKRDALRVLLRTLFRKDDFRECQVEVIERICGRKDTIGLLPTGAGKSLCYQLASFLMPGTTLAVEPIRSLIRDQKQNLNALGIHAVIDISSEDLLGGGPRAHSLRRAKQRYIAAGRAWFAIIAPERLHIPEFRSCVQSLLESVPVSLATIDEAHCVSEWGHSFRTPYLNLGQLLREDFRFGSERPTLLALTATASSQVLLDVVRELGLDETVDLDNAVVEPKSFDRPNLEFEVQRVTSEKRLRVLRKIVEEEVPRFTDGANALVFSQWATGSDGVGKLRDFLGESEQLVRYPIASFASTQERDDATPREEFERQRLTVQDEFKEGKLRVLTCTSAFGMGIDKPDVRLVVHTFMPSSIEDYYQQAGRAGRDGHPARCVLLFADFADEHVDQILDDPSSLNPKKRYHSDPLKNLYFVSSTFVGVEIEVAIAAAILKRIETSPENVAFEMNFADEVASACDRDVRQTRIERGLYRLRIVGAVERYETDYSRRRFIVTPAERSEMRIRTFLDRWLRARHSSEEAARQVQGLPTSGWYDVALAAVRNVIAYAYDIIQRRRRKQLQHLLDAARAGVDNPHEFRRQLHLYLQHSDYTRLLRTVARDGIEEWLRVLAMTEGRAVELERLEAACKRQLADVPDHPGVLLLLALSGMRNGQSPNGKELAEAIRGVAKSVAVGHRVRLYESLLTHFVDRYAPANQSMLLATLAENDADRSIARLCYREASDFDEAHEAGVLALATSILRTVNDRPKKVDP